MAIVAGFDVHRRQITFDALDTETGEVTRGRIDATPAAVRAWVRRFEGDVKVAVEACTGWLFVCDALGASGATPHLAEPVETRPLRGRKRRAKLLDVGEDAARKRVARARHRFMALLHATDPRPAPVVALLTSGEGYAPAERWLEQAGADVRVLRPQAFVRQLPVADAVVLAGGPETPDIHPALYGDHARVIRGSPDRASDLRLLRALRTAIQQDLPVVGICGGHQLLNIALGGALHQDLVQEAASRTAHDGRIHAIRTHPDTLTRRLLGASGDVFSGHHQAVRRLGRGLRPTAISPDGVLEAVELPHRGFVLGLQWHPEAAESGSAGRRVAEALVARATKRAP